MSDASPPPTPVAEPGRVPGTRRRILRRWTRWVSMLAAAVLAALFVGLFSIDLGPAVRKRAEQEATKYLERPMHIGRIKALLRPGEFELDDVVIEGKQPTDLPFFTARRIHITTPWWTLVRRQLFFEVRLTGWKMTVETWPNSVSNLPKIKHPSTGPKRFTSTVRYVYADAGEFVYLDHTTPWTVVAPNLSFNLVRAFNLNAYVGTASFDKGTVQIQKYLPMAARMTTRFTLDMPIVHLHHIDLITDGARSNVKGDVDFDHFPEATYQVDSLVNFQRMREIFFANEPWRVDGDGRFKGLFHLFKGGHQLTGQFASDLATLKVGATTLQFPGLQGALIWEPKRFAVTKAGADFHGGRAAFDYALAPLGGPQPATAVFNVDYDGVDLQSFSRGIDWRGMDLRGRATGHNEMTWTNGQFSRTKVGAGHVTIAPPAGVTLTTVTLGPSQRVVPPEAKFDRDRPLGPLPIGGELNYRFDVDGLDLGPSWAASPSTYVAFQGRADYGSKSNLPFHVTSADWQASDRLLSAILTAAGAPTRPVEVGGYGQFDGVMTGPFSQPRVAGRFAGDAVRAWGVAWGRAVGDIVIDNSYVTVKDGVIGDTPASTIRADGLYSLGYPRKDHGKEIDGHVRVQDWPLADFRTAFNLTDWPVEGIVGAADILLTGAYTGPFGSGTLRIDRGAAWGESFETAAGDLTFNGVGLQISRIVMTKGPGRVNGSAVIKWDDTYSFDAQGEKIPVESLTSFKIEKAPLSGVLQFTAAGADRFSSPSYEFKGRVADLFAGDEGIGDVSGVLQVRNNVLIIPQLEASSSRLQISGAGSIALNDAADANLTFRFTDTSIDPYLRYIAPGIAPKVSPYTRAKVSGSVQVQGELSNVAALSVFATVDDAQLTLKDYNIHNSGDLRLKFENNVVTVSHLVLAGEGTALSLEGEIPLADAPIKLTATGNASLSILQGIFPNLISSGDATLNATIEGPRADPRFSGQATITGGRLRNRTFPHGIEQINGPITFDANAINVDKVRGQMGGGDVTFAGNIRLSGYLPEQFDLSAEGRNMGLRFPEGFKSTVDASLTFKGPVGAPTLGGTVTVTKSTYLEEIDNDLALLALAAAGGGGTTSEPAVAIETSFPMKFDIRLNAPRTLSIDSRDAQVTGSANLELRGTYDAPLVTGLVTIDRGDVFFNGNRYRFRDSQIVFSNSVTKPFFDVQMETRARQVQQIYDITIRITGTPDKLDLTFASDPFLPDYDVISLLLGERPDVGRVEVRSIGSRQLSQQQLMRTAAAQLLAMPISSRVGSVVQRTVPCDTFAIVPLLGNEAALQQLRAGARVTCGKRISERAFLTYSRALNQSQSGQDGQIILLEYEQSDRVSWVLSRNEDRTFALDFRLRHVF